MLWVSVIGTSGYFFGDILEIFLGKLKHYEFKIIISTFIGAMAIYGIYMLAKYLLRKSLRSGNGLTK